MPHSSLTPSLFCPDCLAYLGPYETQCACGYQRPQPPSLPAANQPLWTTTLPGPASAAPLPCSDLLLIPWGKRRGGGGVQALQLADGAPAWTADTSQAVEGGLATSAERVYFGELSRLCLGEGASVYGLDLRSGEQTWRQEVSGSVWSSPLLQEARLLAACGDSSVEGQVHCLDLEHGLPISGWPVRVGRGRNWLLDWPRGPLLITEFGELVFLGLSQGMWGLRSRSQLNVRLLCQPLLSGSLLILCLEQGGIAVVDLATPAALRILPGSQAKFPARPLLQAGRLYAGGHDRQVYCWRLPDGELLWSQPVQRSISSTPAAGANLVAAADIGGKVYAFDRDQGEPAWTFELPPLAQTLRRPAVFAGLAYHNGLFFVGDESGVSALPWHLGNYRWAAQRLDQNRQFSKAALYFTLAAYQECQESDPRQCLEKAAACWQQAGSYEKAAALRQSLDQPGLAADLWCEAGEHWSKTQAQRAAGYYQRAASLYFHLHQPHELNYCTRALARCAHLPYITCEPFNQPDYVQWQKGEFWLRIVNNSPFLAPGPLRFWLGGSLQSAIEARIEAPLQAMNYWTIPLSLVATQLESSLVVELEYESGNSHFPRLSGLLVVTVRAVPPPIEPIRINDVANLQITISAETLEGLRIQTRDVGMLRSEAGIGKLETGDIGYVQAGKVDSLETHGEFGSVKAQADAYPGKAAGGSTQDQAADAGEESGERP